MKLSTRRDIAAPAESVFATLTEYGRNEEDARSRGIKVRRLDDGSAGPAAAVWEVGFEFRGHQRMATVRIVTFDPDQQIAAKAELDGMTVLINIELLPLSPERCRMFVALDIKPLTMTGRLMVQSLKLAKSTIEDRIDKRLEAFAARAEKAHRNTGA